MNDPSVSAPPAETIDLDAIERDLTDVQAALERLNDGSYWTDEVTGDALPDDVLTSYPLTRTVARSTIAHSTATGSTST